MDKRLSHLTEKQVKELVERYYNEEKVKSLIEEFNISVIPSQLVRLFPPKISDEVCSYCNVPLIIKRISRAFHHGEKTPECPSCEHKKGGNFSCICENCRESERLRREKEQQKKQAVLDVSLQINEEEKVSIDDLSFEERVYLGAFLLEGISEGFDYIHPIKNFSDPLAPTDHFATRMFSCLFEKRLIVVHPQSAPEYFETRDIETSDFRFGKTVEWNSLFPLPRSSFYFSLFKVKWALNVKKEALNNTCLVDLLINPSEEVIPKSAYEMWKTISIHEALEYLYYSASKFFGVAYSATEKTVSVFNDLLDDYSVSEIYMIIYQSINYALRQKAERNLNNKHAFNIVLRDVQHRAERAKNETWVIDKFNRLTALPESALSQFFFGRILKIGRKGFYEKPTLEINTN